MFSSTSAAAVAGTSQNRDPLDMLNDIPGITVIRPGQYHLTDEEYEVRIVFYTSLPIVYYGPQFML